MQKYLVILLISISTLTGCGVPEKERRTDQSNSDNNTPLTIVASFYPLAYFTQEIGGSFVEVTTITPAGAEPHDYEPSPKEIAMISDSDLFIYHGSGFEPWAEDIAQNIGETNVPGLEISSAFQLMPIPAEEHDEDELLAFDPHIWLDPVLAQEEVGLLRDQLEKLDPEHGKDYQERAEDLLFRLQQLDEEFQQGLKTCLLNESIVSHNAFSYLGRRYGVTFTGISGISPEAEPSAMHLAKLTDLVREKGITVIFFESLVSPKLSETLALETGITTLVLNPLEGLTAEEQKNGTDYFSVMRDNLDHLKIALQCQ